MGAPMRSCLHAQRLHHRARGLAAGHHQAAHAGSHQALRRCAPARVPPARRPVHAQLGLHGLHLRRVRRWRRPAPAAACQLLARPGQRLRATGRARASASGSMRSRPAGWPASAAPGRWWPPSNCPTAPRRPPTGGQRRRLRVALQPAARSVGGGRPSATPEPAVTSGSIGHRRPSTRRSSLLMHRPPPGPRRRPAGLQPCARGPRRRGPPRRSAAGPRGRRLCACSTRTRLASVIGVSGWSRMPLSLSSWSPTNRWPRKTVRPFSGKAGQAMAKRPPARHQRLGHRADVAGGVESKVEQYLK
jgi:hypothetical protein